MNERYLDVTREGRAGCDQAVTGGNRRDPHIYQDCNSRFRTTQNLQ